MKATWTCVSTTNTPIGVSSHGVSVIERGSAFPEMVVFGGEHEARIPIGSEIRILKLSPDHHSGHWSVLQPDGPSPPARVAHTQCIVNGDLYIFGGRQGIKMEEKPLNDLWRFDFIKNAWEEIHTKGDPPSPRSFHKMETIDGKIFIFGGCGASGRLADLYAFDPTKSEWTKLPQFENIKGRGGSTLQRDASGDGLLVICGFDGGPAKDVYRYEINTRVWSQLEDFPPEVTPRSVCAGITVPDLGIVALIGGETVPSDLGHQGAGNFTNEVIYKMAQGGPFQTVLCNGSSSPCPRGWFECDLLSSTPHSALIVVYGGLSGSDEEPRRNDDTWLLRIEAEEQ